MEKKKQTKEKVKATIEVDVPIKKEQRIKTKY